jgi:hypothetical protein
LVGQDASLVRGTRADHLSGTLTSEYTMVSHRLGQHAAADAAQEAKE